MQWLSEGFTEYYANRTLVQNGLIPVEMFIKKMEDHIGSYAYFTYSPNYGVSLENAGLNKTKNRFGVYDGGWTVALCLDLMIRKYTHGKRSLDDFMRAMWDHFAGKGQQFSFDDVVKAASKTSGTDLSAFFTKHVRGSDVLPFQALLKSIGFDVLTIPLGGEAYILVDPHPTSAQLALRRALLGRH